MSKNPANLGRKKPTPGRVVWYQTDERNGLRYHLPAIVTVTHDSHPGDYPDGRSNPLPAPSSDYHVHLTVFTPGGFGTQVKLADNGSRIEHPEDEDFPDKPGIIPGSGTYVELDVGFDAEASPRSWRWPDLS